MEQGQMMYMNKRLLAGGVALLTQRDALLDQRDALLKALKEVILDLEHEESDGYMSGVVSVEAHRLAQAAIKLVEEKE